MNYLNRENMCLQNSNLNASCMSSSIYSTNTNSNTNNNEYITLFNDWDLDAAFLNSSEPYLSINIELKNPRPRTHTKQQQETTIDSIDQIPKAIYDEWEVINTNDSLVLKNQQNSNLDDSTLSSKSTSLNRSKNYNVMNLDPSGRSLIALWSNTAADKAVSVFQRVLNGLSRSSSFSTQNSSASNANSRSNSIPNSNQPINIFDMSLIEQIIKTKPPLGENEYKNFLDSDGRIVQAQELRQRIFEGGCEPNKRKELWPILLEIFPNQSMTQKQRNEYLKQKSIEYEQLKHNLWYNANKSLHKNSSQIISDSSFDSNTNNNNTHSTNNEETNLYSLAHKIHKDVWRTDRNHKFYSGDSNKNVESLFNILMTYSLSNEGANTYSQGMSDLLSPLLFVLRDEALAYLCFCSLIKRCISNFDVLSCTMTKKIKLLSMLIVKHDPELWSYLSQVGADQLLFVYRWLLIECKREFPFADSLRVLEVMWSTTQNNQEQIQNTKYNRSNSNASSISLKLLKHLGNNSNFDDFLDEEFSDSSVSGKSRHQSQQSNNNNNNDDEHNSTCEICLAEKSFAKLNSKTEDDTNNSTRIEQETSAQHTDNTFTSSNEEGYSTDTDLESINGFNYYSRLNKKRERLRRLSLNSSFFSHKTKHEYSISNKFVPSSLNERNEYCLKLLELKEQQLEDKKRFRPSNFSIKKFRNKSRSVSENKNEDKSNENLVGSLQNGSRFSTSEAETVTLGNNLRTSLTTQHQISDLSEDLESNKWPSPLTPAKKGLRKRKNKRVNKNSSPVSVKSSSLFKNIKKSLKKSHTRINKCFSNRKSLLSVPETKVTEHTCINNSNNNIKTEPEQSNKTDIVYHKNSTSSTSAYVSATSISSSSCSTPFVAKIQDSSQINTRKFPNMPIASTCIPIVKVEEPKTPLKQEQDEEELVYSLSKLDNPFLLFLCLAMFIENREHIMKSQMDANDIACYFDKMTRKHNMKNILNRARYLYTKLYLAKANVINYIQQLMDIQNSP